MFEVVPPKKASHDQVIQTLRDGNRKYEGNKLRNSPLCRLEPRTAFLGPSHPTRTTILEIMFRMTGEICLKSARFSAESLIVLKTVEDEPLLQLSCICRLSSRPTFFFFRYNGLGGDANEICKNEFLNQLELMLPESAGIDVTREYDSLGASQRLTHS